MAFFLKILISAFVIVCASETAKRFPAVGAVIIVLPLNSLLALIWLYRDTGDISQVIRFSSGIFWTILPTLLFFIFLPLLLKLGLKFYLAIVLSSAIMLGGFVVYLWGLNRLGVKI